MKTQLFITRGKNDLKPGVRQYYTLEPKAIRNERKFNNNNSETFRIFGWDFTPMKGAAK